MSGDKYTLCVHQLHCSNTLVLEGCVTSMLVRSNEDGVVNQKAALEVIGSRFRVAAQDRVGPWESAVVCLSVALLLNSFIW